MPALFLHSNGYSCPLTRLLIVGILTVCNTTQIERDLQSIKAFETVGILCRLHSNFGNRKIKDFSDGSSDIYDDEEREVIAGKRKIRSRSESESSRSSDRGSVLGKQKRRKFPPHFNERVEKKYTGMLLSAHNDIGSESESDSSRSSDEDARQALASPSNFLNRALTI